MCDPITIGTVTMTAGQQLAIASAGVGLMGSMSEVNNQNAASERNAANARQAGAYEQDQEMESYVEQNRSMLMTSMDRILQARSNTDLAMVSAVESGGGGQTLFDTLSERSAVEARNIYRDRLERENLSTQANRNLGAITEKAKGRIASTPKTSLNMGHIASAASTASAGFV